MPPSGRRDISTDRSFLNIVERAYLVEPERTEGDLLALGLRGLASSLKIDLQSGRLRECVEAVRGFPLAFETRNR